MKTVIDIAGKTFGKWTVICVDEQHSSKNTYWVCRCECGIEKSVDGTHLRKGRSVSCRRCSEHKDKGLICSRIFFRAKRNAETRNLVFDLGKTNEEARKFLYDLLHKKQKGLCVLSGLPIIVATTIKNDMRGETTASLDRIDSSKGYVRENVQWVHKLVNKMKMDLDESVLISLCESIATHKGKVC